MIRLSDAALLAATKLRTRKVRLIVTVVVAGLLFSVLVAGSIISTGIFKSIGNFSQEGYGSRYLVQANRDLSNNGSMQDKTIQARAEQIYKETVAAKKAAAKELGVDYDEKSELEPTRSFDGSPDSERYLNFSSPAAQQALAERNAVMRNVGLPDLKRVAASYSPLQYYVADQKHPASGSLIPMPGGKEEFKLQEQKQRYGNDDSPLPYGFVVADTPLVRPFMFPGQPIPEDKKDAIPLIVSYQTAEKLKGLSPLDNGASANGKLNRIQELHSTASSLSFSVCYRNEVSAQRLQDAIRVADELRRNKNNKEYVKPSLIYNVPSDPTACSAVSVASDSRTKAEKQYDDRQRQFNARFGMVTEPDQQKISFRVVGLVADFRSASPPDTVAGLMESLIGSSLQGMAAAPSDLYDQLPSIDRYRQIFAPHTVVPSISPSDTLFVEFATAESAKRFIDEKGCTTGPEGQCATSEKPFMLMAFGSNSIALDQLKSQFAYVFTIAGFIVVGIAVIILGSTVGRLIADGRRETAVFRAIGFKRIDIVLIYGFYTVFLCVLIVLFALIVGGFMAAGVDYYFWKDLTDQALLAFNAQDFSRQFRLMGFDFSQLGMIMVALFGAGAVSVIIPLLRNVRRNPIRDMRDE